MTTNKHTETENLPAIGDNGGPDISIMEKVEDLVDATLDAALRLVTSEDCKGVDLTATTKVIKELGGFEVIARAISKESQKEALNTTFAFEDYDEMDEHGHVTPISGYTKTVHGLLPDHRPER